MKKKFNIILFGSRKDLSLREKLLLKQELIKLFYSGRMWNWIDKA
jgi:hypothetical protein